MLILITRSIHFLLIARFISRCTGTVTHFREVSYSATLDTVFHIVLWSRVNFINKDINVCCVSTQVFLRRVKSSFDCSGSRHKNRVYSDTYGVMLRAGERV